LPLGQDPAGWHVVLGNNGAGKTTILRTIALALVGKEGVFRLLPDLRAWLRQGCLEAEVSLVFSQDPAFDKW
jgi:ABC-type cobalamin/Fe3+-siderophores transport system ATPase subunit